jgi:hypothetical protein
MISAVGYALTSIEIDDLWVKKWSIKLHNSLAGGGSTGAVVFDSAPRHIFDSFFTNASGLLEFYCGEVTSDIQERC